MIRINPICAAVIGALALADSALGASDVAATINPTFGQSTPAELDVAALAHRNWRALMAQSPPSGKGCFHVSYPNSAWENAQCVTGKPRVHPVRTGPKAPAPDDVGNGHDYVAQAQGLIGSVVGSFNATGVTSETGVDVLDDGFGIVGPNEYTLQINTNDTETTSACAGHTGCTVWQQYVYATDYSTQGEAALYIQYWLVNWGTSPCPANWYQLGVDCYANSELTKVPDLPITDLNEIQLVGTASPGGYDVAGLFVGDDGYFSIANDSMLDISSVWKQAEFNVLGDAGLTQAQFNNGSRISVTVALTDGSNSAPTCVEDQGTAGETNNLALDGCQASVASTPQIQFTELREVRTIIRPIFKPTQFID